DLVGYSGNTTVNVGNAGRLTDIQGAISIINPPNYTTVIVNAQNDPVARTLTLDTVTTDAEYVRLTGLSPGTLYTRTNDTAMLVGNGGPGNNVYRVRGTPARAITRLTGGAGDDTFEFAAGQGGLQALDGGGGTNTLNYSAYVTNVYVNLVTGVATRVGGGIAHIQKPLG